MGRHLSKSRDRWVINPRPAGPRRKAQGSVPTTAIQTFYDEDTGEASSTAGILIEDERDDSPIPIGILNSEGEMIYRIPYRDTLPVGFHYTRDQYDEEGNFIGDEVEYYYDDEITDEAEE